VPADHPVDRRVLKPVPDSVAERNRALVDRPRFDSVAVVYLLKRDACLGHQLLDGFCVRDRGIRVGVQRLDHDSHAPACRTRSDERLASPNDSGPASMPTPWST